MSELLELIEFATVAIDIINENMRRLSTTMSRMGARRGLGVSSRDELVLALAERMVAGKGAEAEYVDVEPEEREEIRSRVQSYLARFKKREEELKPSESKSKEGGESG
ncbi:MAG: hypothetical protein QXQ91_03505 [Nanopusillaceae archaeon]